MGQIKTEPNVADANESGLLDTTMKDGDEVSYEERLLQCTEIAKPMSSKKTLSRIRKLIKKAVKDIKSNVVFGTKSVQTALRRGVTGVVLISGSVRPIETLCHIPGICEEKGLPYIYVTCNTDLSGGKISRAPIMIIKPKPEYMELYDKLVDDIKKTPLGY